LKTHTVQGKVILKDGNIEDLRESHVEFELESDSTVRGSGLIAGDGRFSAEMLHKGQVLRGLPPGQYRGRIVLSDEGPASKKGRSVIARRYRDFKTANVSIAVPASEEVLVTVATNER
jgi:hypothetical protein